MPFEILPPESAKFEITPPSDMHVLPTMRESMAQELATRSGWEKTLAGIGTFTDNASIRLKQLLGNKLTPQDIANVQANRDMTSLSGHAFLGNIAGNVMATGYPAASIYRGGAAVAGQILPRAAAALAPTAGAALSGGLTPAVTEPTLQGESTAKNMGWGALGGVLGDTAARIGSRVLQPITQSPAVQDLLSRGIVPTPGQAAGGSVNKIEQTLQSIPLTGEIIGAGRARPRMEFNKAQLNLAMPEGQVSQAGNAGLEEVKGTLSAAYDKVFAGKTVTPTPQLFNAIHSAKSVTTLPLNQGAQKDFDSIIQKVLIDRIPTNGQMPADSVKSEIIGDLGKEAQKLLRSPLRSESSLGESLMAARNAVQSWLVGEIAQSSPAAAKQLAMIDPAYANSKMIGKAVDRAAAQGGLFTPYQAIRASRPGDVRNLAVNAQSVLGNTVPNSGTADRGLLAFLAMHPSSIVNPAEYLGIPAASLLYSRPGSRYLLGDLIPGQATGAAALRGLAPYAATAGSAATQR